MLNVGTMAPEIDAATRRGPRFTLSMQGGLCTIVYFFAGARSANGAGATRGLFDNYAELTLGGANIVGVTTDALSTPWTLQTPFPLIADEDGSISRAYEVFSPDLNGCCDALYVLGDGGRVEAVLAGPADPKQTVPCVLAFVDQLFRWRQSQAACPSSVRRRLEACRSAASAPRSGA